MPKIFAPHPNNISIDLNDRVDYYTADCPMNRITDTTSNALYVYFCEAPIGIATSVAGWRISRLTVATGVEIYADGNSKYDNIADNRNALTYSGT